MTGHLTYFKILHYGHQRKSLRSSSQHLPCALLPFKRHRAARFCLAGARSVLRLAYLALVLKVETGRLSQFCHRI